MEKKLTLSLQQIPEAAKQIAQSLKGGEIFALIGPLGAGKTTFTQAVGKNLNIRHKITSPTFTLLHAFEAKMKKTGNKVTFYHLDLYRTKSFREAKALGLTEFWGKKDTVTFIEWADKIKRHLPKKATFIKFV